MEAEPFDTELFIDEVQKRRCIWDMESIDYKNRALKKSVWQELVDIFSGDSSTSEQKKLLGTTLQKKWKSVRDNFSRELKKQKRIKTGTGASKQNMYVYFQRLTFLDKSLTNNNTTNNLQDDIQFEEELQCEDLQQPAVPGPSQDVVFGNKKLKLNPVDKQFVDILNKTIARREKQEEEIANQDKDKLFCLSLYKELRKVPEHARIRTKIQILEVIQRAQDFYSPHMQTEAQGYHPYQPQSYNEFGFGVNRQYNQRPPVTQDGFSGNIGYNIQPAPSGNLASSSALSPADSITSQTSSAISDIYN